MCVLQYKHKYILTNASKNKQTKTSEIISTEQHKQIDLYNRKCCPFSNCNDPHHTTPHLHFYFPIIPYLSYSERNLSQEFDKRSVTTKRVDLLQQAFTGLRSAHSIKSKISKAVRFTAD